MLCVCIFVCMCVCVRTNVIYKDIPDSVSNFPCLDKLHRVDTEGAKSGERAWRSTTKGGCVCLCVYM